MAQDGVAEGGEVEPGVEGAGEIDDDIGMGVAVDLGGLGVDGMFGGERSCRWQASQYWPKAYRVSLM